MTDARKKADTKKPSVAEVRALLRHPEVRNYQVAALAALVFIFGILFGRGSELGGLLTATFGVAGVFLRWTAAPLFVIILAMYFLVFPGGFPELGSSNPFAMRSVFQIEDVILTMALLVYIASQYRLFGLLMESVPTEGRLGQPESPVRRPPSAIPEREIAPLFLAVFAAVIAGQVAWWVISSIRVDTSGGFSFSFVEAYRSRSQPGQFSAPWSRFILFIGMIGFTATFAAVFFSVKRYRAMTALEARMVLQDVEWTENHRELSRLETWRMWAKRTLQPKGRGTS